MTPRAGCRSDSFGCQAFVRLCLEPDNAIVRAEAEAKYEKLEQEVLATHDQLSETKKTLETAETRAEEIAS